MAIGVDSMFVGDDFPELQGKANKKAQDVGNKIQFYVKSFLFLFFSALVPLPRVQSRNSISTNFPCSFRIRENDVMLRELIK
jgi:hypothetical protein